MRSKPTKYGKEGHTGKRKDHASAGLRIVALFEGAKGVLVLLAGFGVLSLIHKNIHQVAVQLVRHFHLNPASHYPEIFLNTAGKVTDIQIWLIAFAAMLYATIRVIEAFGLWMQRQWAEWFGLLTGAMYVPIELYEVMRGVTWPKVTVLIVNTIIVTYLLFVILKSKKRW